MESKLYLSFFRRYLLLFLLLPFLFSSLFYLKTVSEKDRFVLSRFFELQHTQENAVSTTLIADEIVTLIRSENFQSEMSISEEVEVIALKPGPVSVSLTLKGAEGDKLRDVNNKLTDYLREKYSFVVIGKDVESFEAENFWLVILGGIGVGLLVGLMTALILEYFRKY